MLLGIQLRVQELLGYKHLCAMRAKRLQSLQERVALLQQLQPPLPQERERQEGRKALPAGGFIPAAAFLQILDDALTLILKLNTLLLPLTATEVSDPTANSGSSSNGSRGSVLLQECKMCLHALPLYLDALADGALQCAGMKQGNLRVYRSENFVCADAPALPTDARVWFRHSAQLCGVFAARMCQAASKPSVAEAVEPRAPSAQKLVRLLDPTTPRLRGVLLQAAAAAGPGSREQRQLYGLLRSMLKWAGVMGPQQQGLAKAVRTAAAVAGANILARMNRCTGIVASCTGVIGSPPAAAGVDGLQGDTVDSGLFQNSEGISCGTQRTSSAAVTEGEGGSKPMPEASVLTAADALLPLPWLWLLGVCCVQWSQELALLPADCSPKEMFSSASCQPKLEGDWGVLSALPHDKCCTLGVLLQSVTSEGGLTLFNLCLGALSPACVGLNASSWGQVWTEASQATASEVLQGTALYAQGFGEAVFAAVKQKLFCEAACGMARVAAHDSPEAPLALTRLVTFVARLGMLLCALPHKRCCNNPGCVALRGPSELQLVKGRSNTCSGCRTARYCSSECMKQHWKQHRPVCKALAAAAAAAAAAGAGEPMAAG